MKKYIRASKYPNWRGCKNIYMKYYNDWADPDLIWTDSDGETWAFNYYDIEDALWNNYMEEHPYDQKVGDTEYESEFDKYVQENAEGYLEDVIHGGYFDNGSHSWHDRYREAK